MIYGKSTFNLKSEFWKNKSYSVCIHVCIRIDPRVSKSLSFQNHWTIIENFNNLWNDTNITIYINKQNRTFIIHYCFDNDDVLIIGW